MEKTVKVGIIGLGYWGPNLLRNFQANSRSVVKYSCDILEENIQKVKDSYPFVTFTKDYLDILKDKEVDLVCIATPPETHFQLAKNALRYGKHVLIEKPMTTNTREGKKLIELAEKAGKLLLVDHTFVFSPPVRKLKELIDGGELGEVLYFDSERVNLGLLQKNINVIWDLAPHDFSMLIYLFPNLKPVSLVAVGSKHVHARHEDMAHIMLRYENDFVAHIHVSWLSPVKIRKTVISGNKKMVWYDDAHTSEKIKIYDKGIDVDLSKESPFFPTYRSGDILIPKLENREPLSIEVEHVVNCVMGIEEPLMDGYAGLKIVRLLEACDKSLRAKKEVLLKDWQRREKP
jgi:predicted dehydrogenase